MPTPRTRRWTTTFLPPGATGESASLLMDARRAAGYVGVSLKEVYRLTSTGQIIAVKWGKGGRNLRWRKTDLDLWVASLPKATGPVRERGVGLGREAAGAAS